MNEHLSYLVPVQWRNVNIYTLLPQIQRKTRDVDFDIFDFEILFHDKATNDLIRKGDTIGCFYIESPGMRSLLPRLDVHSFEMLIAASSIIRPGVAESGMMHEFIARHKDPMRRKYLLKEMEQYLSETYGVMVYQEDVIKIAHYVVGLSLEEADLMRRAMSGKMRSHEAMQKIKEDFFYSCRTKGLSNYHAKELWRQIESFAGYSFCKAHSASFALLSYQVAYLKAHYPAEFMESVLNNGGGFYSVAVYVQEAKRMGLKIELPCVNKSCYEYIGSGKTIGIGLMAIKNLAYNSINIILNERKKNGKYISLTDFLIRTKLGYKETAILIKCGAMDCFNFTRPSLLRLLDIYIYRRRMHVLNYNDLFMYETFNLEKEVVSKTDYTIEERCRIEYEIFGYMVTRHPLYFFGDWINSLSVIMAEEMQKYRGKNVKMVGWYMTSKRIKTRKGKIMKFLSLEDLTGTFEAIIFPTVYYRVADKTMSMGPYLIEGQIDKEPGTKNIIVSNLEVLSSVMVKASARQDIVENKYYGDIEKVSEEELAIVQSLGKERLKQAYAC